MAGVFEDALPKSVFMQLINITTIVKVFLFKTFMKMKRENHLGLLDLKKLHHCRIVVWPP